MNEWGVVTVITALVGLAVSSYNLIIKPRQEMEAKLNSTLTQVVTELKGLATEVKHLSEAMSKTEKRVDRHSERLDDHESRLTVLEVKDEVKQ